ncbi:hypothetical protein C8R44DRAFT_813896 [Mycena epipterygia]|nr:hypothetical protein C8R44DRAFT_813896 [Mycena epipterygia]
MGILSVHLSFPPHTLLMHIRDSTQDITSAVEEAAEDQRLAHQSHDRVDISQSVRDVARKQERYHEFAERDGIIEWYSPLNFFLRQADIFNSRQLGTGQWLLEHDLFKEWKSGTNNPLEEWESRKTIWCRGMQALKSLPRDLSGTFDEVVHRINRQSEEEKALAWLALSWVTNARRPLEPSELRLALAVEEGTTELNGENLLDIETILSVCAGLVIINEEDNRVRLVHYTIQDYLERIQDKEFPRAHSKITATCITYLLFDTFPRDNIGGARCKYLFSTNPLLEYAVNYTLIHAHGQPEHDIKEAILSFLDQCSGWVELWNRSHRLERIPTSGTRVWIAAFFDLRQVTECLIRDEVAESHAVYMSLVRGHMDVARILVGNRTYLQALGEYYGSALQFAISKKNQETVRLLLAHTIDLDGPHKRMLQTAVSKGDLAMVKLLIENDVNPVWAREDPSAPRLLIDNKDEIVRSLTGDIDTGGCSSEFKSELLSSHKATARREADVKEMTKATGGERCSSSASRSPRVPRNSENPAGGSGQTARSNVDNLPLLPPSAMGYLAMTLAKGVPDMEHGARAIQRASS